MPRRQATFPLTRPLFHLASLARAYSIRLLYGYYTVTNESAPDVAPLKSLELQFTPSWIMGLWASPKSGANHVHVSTSELLCGDADADHATRGLTSKYRKGLTFPKLRARFPFVFWCILVLVVIMLLSSIILGSVFGALAHSAPVQDGTSAVTQVDLGYAQYQSAQAANGVRKWLGIRYAASPTGDLRFRAPQDPPTVSGVQQATSHGPICIGQGGGSSEDCLFLDVYAPANATSSSALPIYIFLQGGGLNSNANPNYDGTGLINFSNGNIIIVTLGYRVSLYGFLASKEVLADGTANNGLRDQRKAMEWVQKYISKFGGDPKRVTIGGDSAGAGSIALHLAAYGGRQDNLFAAAAAESPSFGAQFTVAEAQYQYDDLIGRANCNTTSDSLACLRNKTLSELKSLNKNIKSPYAGVTGPPLYMYSNVIDNDFTTDYTYRSYQNGKYVKVPAIWGADTNDGRAFAPTSIKTVTSMNNFLLNNFPQLTDAQLSQIDTYYPKAAQYEGDGEYYTAAANAYGDMRYKCPAEYLSSRASDDSVPVWNYRYNVINNKTSGLQTGHTTETNAIWGPSYVTNSPPKTYLPGEINANIVPVMMGYWTSFIRAHDPNPYRYAGTPEWSQWVTAKWDRIVLEANTTRMENVSADEQKHCSYLWSIAVDLKQ